MRPSIFNDPIFHAAAEACQKLDKKSKKGKKWNQRRTPSGMIERGFSRGRRKVGEKPEAPGKVKVLMKNGRFIAPPSTVIAKINESKHNLTQKLERLGLIRNVDQIAVPEREPRGADHGVMACGLTLPGDLAALESPSSVEAEAILPGTRQVPDSNF